jgi:hypothetical protein
MALELTHPLPKMSARNISWGVKVHLHVPFIMKSGCLTSWNPQGLSRPVQVLFYHSIKVGIHVIEWIQEVIITVCCFMDCYILRT